MMSDRLGQQCSGQAELVYSAFFALMYLLQPSNCVCAGQISSLCESALKNIEVMAELQNKKQCNINTLMFEINTHLLLSLNFDRQEQFLNGTKKIVL